MRSKSTFLQRSVAQGWTAVFTAAAQDAKNVSNSVSSENTFGFSAISSREPDFRVPHSICQHALDRRLYWSYCLSRGIDRVPTGALPVHLGCFGNFARTALLRRFVGYRRRLAIIRLGLLSAREDQLEDHIYEPQHKLQRHQEKQVIHDALPVRIDFPQQRQG